jgi:hypothetical protein
MSYTLQDFARDAHDILKKEPGTSGREKVADTLSRLVKDDDFLAQYCEKAKPGRHVIYEDPELGWQIMVHHMTEAHKGVPHDHGKSWAIYCQAIKHTDMSLWKRLDGGGGDGSAKLEKVKDYQLTRGVSGVYNGSEIHAIAYPAGAVFVRVTGCDLDTVERLRYDVAKGTVKSEKAASLLHAGQTG